MFGILINVYLTYRVCLGFLYISRHHYCSKGGYCCSPHLREEEANPEGKEATSTQPHHW